MDRRQTAPYSPTPDSDPRPVDPETPEPSNLPKMRAGSTGRCNTGLQFTRRGFKAQGLSRALIEAQGYLVEIGLRVTGQVSVFLGKYCLSRPLVFSLEPRCQGLCGSQK
jgi:hypothetical protein